LLLLGAGAVVAVKVVRGRMALPIDGDKDDDVKDRATDRP
jgi:hypothetical protein